MDKIIKLWLPVLSCLQRAFGSILSLPGTPSHQKEGKGRHSSQTKKWAALVYLDCGVGFVLELKGCRIGSPESPQLSAAGLHIVPWEESSPV